MEQKPRIHLPESCIQRSNLRIHGSNAGFDLIPLGLGLRKTDVQNPRQVFDTLLRIANPLFDGFRHSPRFLRVIFDVLYNLVQNKNESNRKFESAAFATSKGRLIALGELEKARRTQPGFSIWVSFLLSDAFFNEFLKPLLVLPLADCFANIVALIGTGWRALDGCGRFRPMRSVFVMVTFRPNAIFGLSGRCIFDIDDANFNDLWWIRSMIGHD